MTSSAELRAIVEKRNAKLANKDRTRSGRVPSTALHGQLGTASPELIKALKLVDSLTRKR